MTKLLIKLLATSKSRYTQIILYKSYADLMAESSRYYIGFLWWILEPVIDMAVYYIMFGLVFNNKTPNFVPFLLIGTVTWRWLQSSILLAANSIYAYRPLMDHVYVPKMIFPTVTIITNSFKFFIVFTLLVVFLLLYGIPIGIAWSAIPVLFAVELLFIASLAYLFAGAVPFFPDLRVVLDSIFKILLFLSGVFYPLSKLPGGVNSILRLNPAVHLIEGYRKVLISNQWPDWQPLLIIAAVSTVMTAIGIHLIARNDTSYPKLSL